MSLPPRARLVVALAALGGAAALAGASARLSGATPSTRALVLGGVFGLLVLGSWLRPLLVYVGEQSEAIHLDEGFLVVLVLLVGPDLTVVVFGAASVTAQLLKRRPLAKSLFNTGQLVAATGVAAAVFDLVGAAGRPLSATVVAAALLAAAIFSVANSAAVAAILWATGAPWRSGILDGLDVRLRVEGGGTVVATVCALVTSAFPWALPLAVLPLLILRQVLAGHFEARRDRARMQGLFQSTVAVHRSIGAKEVTRDILDAARALLRCQEAALAPAGGGYELSSALPLGEGDLVLGVDGRSRTEPFDAADQSLLDALAAVGAGALSNAALYESKRRQQERLSAITSSLGEGVCAVDRSGRVIFANRAACTMLGWELQGGRDDVTVLGEESRGPLAPPFVVTAAERAFTTPDGVSYDTRFPRADGSLFDVACTVSPIAEGGTVTGAVLVFRDISERKQLEEQLARHAFHDALTSLPNRRLFLDHLDHALRRAERNHGLHAVLFCDVDRFKIVNDSLGHHVGDSLLMAIAERIAATLRPGDTLARFGGDEFTLLLEDVQEGEAAAAAERILEALRSPITLPDGHEVVASVSVGIGLSRAGAGRDDVLHDADVAMYQAKAVGRGGTFRLFDAGAMGLRSAERIDLEAGLRRALERGQIEVYYQPLYSVAKRTLVAVEALVRWNHPERGVLSPEHFIGLAEDTGLILPLGREVLLQACRKARAWAEDFAAPIAVGINLSARQFQDPALISDIEQVFARTGVDPAQLCFEITESLAMEDVARTNEVLARLKDLGARVAIDDFGTGYSALGYLASFPIDVVKIDRTFVEGIASDPVKSAIVSAVITMSKAIGSTTVVEGVESEEQLLHLRALGCTVAQGHYLSLPLRDLALEALLPPERAGMATIARPARRRQRVVA
ncbi:MAG TPA: EAL domain-containing protein [Acidimicrobiales bacterium]|nr:EAL domain-containing protein [Acidimicrobiales bacterium]